MPVFCYCCAPVFVWVLLQGGCYCVEAGAVVALHSILWLSSIVAVTCALLHAAAKKPLLRFCLLWHAATGKVSSLVLQAYCNTVAATVLHAVLQSAGYWQEVIADRLHSGPRLQHNLGQVCLHLALMDGHKFYQDSLSDVHSKLQAFNGRLLCMPGL